MRTLRLAFIGLVLISGATEAYAQAEVRATAFLGLARVHKERGDLAEAARDFEQAAAVRGLTVGEKTEYFWILREVDARRALDLGRDILHNTPADDALRDALIATALALKDEPMVQTLALDGRQAGKDTALWNRRLGESALRTSRVNDAADAYLAAAASPLGQPSDRLAAATALTSAGRYAEALTAWRDVQPALFADRPDLVKLRLLAFARSAPPSEAAAEITSWQQANGLDRDVQSWLVDVWVGARNFGAAYAATRPLTSGPDADRWLRRSGELARSAGLQKEAAAAYEALVRLPRSTRTDRVVLVDILLEQGATDRALPVVDTLVASLRQCDEQTLSLIDRVADTRGTDRLRSAAQRLGCIDSRWGRRIIERSVAEGRYQLALDTLDAVSTSDPASQRLRGQLQLWMGQPSAAAATLTPFMAAHPDDLDGRLALVDALRAVDRAGEALTVAQPLFTNTALPVDRRASLAELALEAGQPKTARSLVAELPASYLPGKAILGRTLLVEGKPAEAMAVLAPLGTDQLTPAAAAALIDAVLATRGFEPAKPIADRFGSVEPAWRDVAKRRLTIDLVMGANQSAMDLRKRLCATDPTPCAHADAEAVRVLAADWQQSHKSETLERLTAVIAAAPATADARATVAGALLDAGQPDRALALLSSDALPLSRHGAAVLTRTLAQLSTSQHRSGNQPEALALARRAVANDPAYAPAWFAVFDAAIAMGQDEVTTTLTAFEPVAASDPAMLVSVGDHVSGVVQGSRDRAIRRLIALLSAAPASEELAPQLTVARLYTALEEWGPAVKALDAELARQPNSREALRLRADVLGWSGQHAAAIEAYDRYLELAPSDVDAQRQQARVAGWGARYAEANRRYTQLTRRYPENRVVAAEAAAKRAFYAEHWGDAVRRYDAWIRVEPDNSEARFERAVALRAAGNPKEADAALADLALQTGHRLATLALSRSQENRSPSVSVVNDFRSASGYGGSRLLSLRQQGAAAMLPVGSGARLSLAAGQVRAESDDRSQPGFRATVGGQVALSSHVAFDANVGVWAFSSSSTTTDARVAGTWHRDDRIAVAGGVQQQPIHENLSTVDSGLTGRGPFAGLRIGSSMGSIETTAAWLTLTDGNSRREITLSAGRVVAERVPSLRLIAWGQSLHYASPRSYYFSPASFLRVDGGAEYSKLLQRPRFAGDRQSSLALSFLEGTDNHGVLYHHPAARLHLQLSRRVALNGTAELIRSSNYRESLFFVGFDVADLARHR